jgi:hypothetical protein
MLDTEDWKAIMKTQGVQIAPSEPWGTTVEPVWITLTCAKTHEAVDPPTLTVRSDQIEGWLCPWRVDYHSSVPSNTKVTCTRVRAFGEWWEVEETQEEIIKRLLQARGVPFDDESQ